ncbi:hypothetical protein [Pseudomonas qingdaonensis]|uniref:hypothetical protein n=1 Tax=Pseudomonas qingdaonensis TaxID=2056231 RepID=UPI000AD00BD4|nr:hypothetical protein [Pseudomonas qingdaonensis]
MCIIAQAARLDPLDATGKVDSCDKQNDVASYPGAHSRVPFLGASIMSATSFSVQLQNEMEGKINYFHYEKFNDPTKGTKSPLNSPQTIYDFNLYPGGKFIATTAESLTVPPGEPKVLRFKLTNNSDFFVGLLRKGFKADDSNFPENLKDELKESFEEGRRLIIKEYDESNPGIKSGVFSGGDREAWTNYDESGNYPEPDSARTGWLLWPGCSRVLEVFDGSVWAVSEVKHQD